MKMAVDFYVQVLDQEEWAFVKVFTGVHCFD
jgi:hypothetical protein